MTESPNPDGSTAAALTNADVSAADAAHVFHSWSAQKQISPVPIAGGAGSELWDYDGNRWLDFSAQLVYLNLGHQHPEMIEAIQAQAAALCTIAPQYANDTRNRAAQRIIDHAPAGLNKVFFTNGGADALENAVRLARGHTGRHKVLTAYRSYHGATNLAISLTGEPRRWANEPAAPGVVHFFGPYLYRSAFYSTTPEEEAERALAHLADVIRFEGAHTVAAVVLESVVGTNGILVPPPGYLEGVRALCTEHGIMMISDEVMAGFGRTGEWFAVDNFGVSPDLLCFAKGVNSGYVPLGGVAMTEDVAATYADRPFPGGLTYSGHPLACAAAVAAIDIMERDGIVERSKRLGAEIFAPRLAAMAEEHPSVGEVRGLGCFWAIELVKDQATREMFVPFNAAGADAAPMAAVIGACKERGVVPFAHFNRLQLAPPLIVTEDEVNRALDAVDEALGVADSYIAR